MRQQMEHRGWGWMTGLVIVCMWVSAFASILQAVEPPLFPPKQIRFHFANTDVEELLRVFQRESGFTIVNQESMPAVMAGALSGRPEQGKKNTPARGEVTVMSDGLITLDQAFVILQDVLQSVGVGYVIVVNREKKILEVVPGAVAAQRNLPITVGLDPAMLPDSEGTVKHIVFLKNLKANPNLRGDIQVLMPSTATVLLNEANAFVLVAPVPAIRNILTILKNLDEAVTAVATVKIYQLKYAVAKDLAATLKTIFGAIPPGRLTGTDPAGGFGGMPQSGQGYQVFSGQGGQGPNRSITIVDHPPTNSIVVMAPNDQHPIVDDSIKQLDRLPSQVMVEATILEVLLNDDLRHGVEWLLRPGLNQAADNLTGRLESPSAQTLVGGGIASLVPGQYLLQISRDKIDSFIRGLEERTNVKVVANPKVYAQDNQKARWQSGSKIPFLTSTPGPAGATATQNIDQRDVGISLELTPHINEDRQVNMAVKQEVSSVSQQTFFGAPVVDTRVVESTILVKDGMSVVLGGMIREENREVNRQVPILGDIPLLGFLFKTNQTVTQRQEIIVILSPHVAVTMEEAEKLKTKQDKKFMDEHLKP